MQFDPDIIVRLHWSGVAVVNLTTPVTYPVPTLAPSGRRGYLPLSPR